MHHAHLRDRSRRRYNFSCQDRRLVAHVLRHCYQFLQDRYRSSTGHPTGSGHKRTPRSTGIFSTEWRFSPPTSHARISAAAYSGTAWLPAAAYCFLDCVQLTDTFQGFLCFCRLSTYRGSLDIENYCALR